MLYVTYRSINVNKCIKENGSMSIKMLNMKSEHVLCVMEQLWARGPRHHLLSSVAPALGHSSLLHQLFVHLLPARAAAAHDLLLREDPAGSASSGDAGELTAHVTFDLCVMSMPFSVSVCVSRSAGSTGPQLRGGKAVSF